MKIIPILIAVAMFITSCSAGSDEEVILGDPSSTVDEIENIEAPIQTPIESDFETPEVVSPVFTPTRTNPPCSSLAFGDGLGGDLWLPISRGNGLPVYLLNGAWQEPASVEAQLVTGAFEQGNFTGFNNPDPDGLRQHFRFTRSCEQYSGLLIVTDATQSCEVILPSGVCDRID